MNAKRFSALIVVASLISGCGADVASSAATTAELQAKQAKQAMAQASQVQSSMDAAMKNAEAAASRAANQ